MLHSFFVFFDVLSFSLARLAIALVRGRQGNSLSCSLPNLHHHTYFTTYRHRQALPHTLTRPYGLPHVQQSFEAPQNGTAVSSELPRTIHTPPSTYNLVIRLWASLFCKSSSSDSTRRLPRGRLLGQNGKTATG